MHTWDPDAIPPDDALARLLDGNRRFVAGQGSAFTGFRADLADRQSPFAIIVGCSDSRVPAEIVFDVGLGDLFVVRVAGNIVAPSQVGSVEFAVSRFGTRLVVVLGHTRCGAIDATLRSLSGGSSDSRNVASITERIAPNIRSAAALPIAPELRFEACVADNVRAAVSHLTYGSRMLEDLSIARRVHLVGAVYAVETGVVKLLD